MIATRHLLTYMYLIKTEAMLLWNEILEWDQLLTNMFFDVAIIIAELQKRIVIINLWLIGSLIKSLI